MTKCGLAIGMVGKGMKDPVAAFAVAIYRSSDSITVLTNERRRNSSLPSIVWMHRCDGVFVACKPSFRFYVTRSTYRETLFARVAPGHRTEQLLCEKYISSIARFHSWQL